jgi:hypothetical protein
VVKFLLRKREDLNSKLQSQGSFFTKEKNKILEKYPFAASPRVV